MKKFKITWNEVWDMSRTVVVEANSEEEARALWEKGDLPNIVNYPNEETIVPESEYIKDVTN